MTQVFEDDGRVEPATLIYASPVEVSLVRTVEKDGYSAVQVRSGSLLREFRPKNRKDDVSFFKIGDTLDITQFVPGDVVSISGTSKSKGFQGGVKRHGFKGASKTHGTKHAHRQPGSISGIGRGGGGGVHKGKRMAGRMGGERVTVAKLKVLRVMPAEHILAVGGAIPGNRKGTLEVSGVTK